MSRFSIHLALGFQRLQIVLLLGPSAHDYRRHQICIADPRLYLARLLFSCSRALER